MEGEVDEGRVALEKEAREMGWVPKDQFRGPEDQWRDADEFVSRGREILPIIKANSRKLLGELNATREELKTLKGKLTTAEQTQKDLLEHQASEIKRQVEAKLKDLRSQKLEAIEEGDHKLAARLEGEIDETRDELAKATTVKSPAPAPAPQAPQVEPWAQEFANENAEWFGTDKVKTGLFGGICDQLVETTSLRGAALLSEAKRRMDALIDKTPAQRMAKSEPGGGGWEGSSSGGKSGKVDYNSLPADAKAVCDRQEAKFVGAGKAFKTQAEWRAHYAKSVLG